MKCKSVHKKLIFYIDKELVQSEHDFIDNHLLECETCLHLYNELLASFNLIEKKKVLKPNPFLYTRIKQSLDNQAKNELRVLKPAYVRVLQPVLLTFVLMISVFSGIKLGSTYEIKSPENSTISQTTEFYFNDIQQEKLEAFLLND